MLVRALGLVLSERILLPSAASPHGPEADAGPVADCVRRAQQGDQEAFAELVRRHERMVLRTALRLLGRLESAEDAAQEAFLRLHKYLHRFDDSRELGPWLYRIVVNACHDLARRERRGVSLEERDEPASDGGAAAVERAIGSAWQRRIVEQALQALPHKERTALVLRDLEGLPTAEVARILGTAEGTVRAQIASARLKIKRYVETLGRRPA